MELFLISLIPFFMYGFLSTHHAFHMLQQNWYNDGNRYLKWIKENNKQIFLKLDLLFLIFLVGKFFSFRINVFMFFTIYIILYVLSICIFLIGP